MVFLKLTAEENDISCCLQDTAVILQTLIIAGPEKIQALLIIIRVSADLPWKETRNIILLFYIFVVPCIVILG